MFDVHAVRSDFPILQKKINGYPLAYLDNSATTQKPRQVIEAISGYYENSNANAHRGVHTLAQEATVKYEESKKIVADFIGGKFEETVFVRNTTEAINLVAHSLGEINLRKGDEIILTQMEHHSNIVPWQIVAQKTGTFLKFIPLTDSGELDLQSLEQLLSPKTKILSLVHVSNVLGTINPVKQIIKKVKQYNREIICIIDGAQSVPHMPVSVKDLGCDFLAFSGHKMVGPMAIGVLWGKRELLEAMPPFLGGGDMISAVYWDKSEYNELPYKFEAGTSNIAGAVGLAEAVKYLQKIGMESIQEHEKELTEYCLEKLADIPEVTVLGPKDPKNRSGLIAFEFKKVHAHDVAQVLDSVGVAARSGQHCCMPLHTLLNLNATTRASFYLYNTKTEIDQLIKGLQKVKTVFGI
ncbi:MAG: aminotransferase class V-fold PLP-dependent enzyme [Patescibacteria group bacterium]|jgi:cysteine desulfurase/selenocysteine lyase